MHLRPASLWKTVLCAALVACVAYVAALEGCRPPAPGDVEDDEDLSGSCGVERWSVKTGTDAAASQVNMNPQDTTIQALRALPMPAGNTSGSGRFAGTAEMQVWRLSNVTLVEYKLEGDSDTHMVLKDAAGNTMIAEIPSPSCVSGGPWAPAITAARNTMNAKFTPSGSFQAANVPVTVTGVGFFDLLHGQTGLAPNGIELHAVLSLCFNGLLGSGCGPATTPDFGLTATPAAVTASPGASGSSTIAVTGNGGLLGSVALSASGLPPGASATFANPSVAIGSSTALTLSAGTAAAGTYAVVVTGTSGALTHTTTVSWTITGGGSAPDFALGADPATLSTAQGELGSATISVGASGGFTGQVALTAVGTPIGASLGLSPADLAGGATSTLTFSAGSAATGTYAVTILGASGALNHSTSLTWIIEGGSDGGSPGTDGGSPGSDGGSPGADGGAIADGGPGADGGQAADSGPAGAGPDSAPPPATGCGSAAPGPMALLGLALFFLRRRPRTTGGTGPLKWSTTQCGP